MEANPDTVTYYMPIVETNATSYQSLENGELYGAWNGVTTVASSVGDSYLYMAFLGGDQPLKSSRRTWTTTRSVSCSKSPTAMPLLPSSRATTARWLWSNPREFNNSEDPSLYLPDLAQLVGATDLIVINYPFIPVNEYYITRLNRLAGPIK